MTERSLFHTGLLSPALAYGIGLILAVIVVTTLLGEMRRHRQSWRYLLVVTRLAMLAILVLLLADPNIVSITRTVEPGHRLMLVDDSASMFVKDNLQDQQTLLELATLLDLPAARAHDRSLLATADQVATLRRELAVLNTAVTESTDAIAMGLPWSERAETAVADSRAQLDALGTLLTTLTANTELPATITDRAADVRRTLGDGNDGGTALLSTVSLTPAQSVWTTLARQQSELDLGLAALHSALLEQQRTADAAFLATAGVRDALATELASMDRHVVASRILQALAQGEHDELLNLNRGSDTVDATTAVSSTDLVKPLVDTLAARPLELFNAVVLASDGGQNLDYNLDDLNSLSRRRIPLIVTGIGGETGSEPLRLDQLDVPGIATADKPMTLRVVFDADAPAGTELTVVVDLARKENTEAAETTDATPETESTGSSARSRLRRYRNSGSTSAATTDESAVEAAAEFPYTTTGVVDARGQVRLAIPLKIAVNGYNQLSITASMASPTATVTTTAPIYLSADRPRILMIAERPDRLASAILAQRRHGILVYPIFTYGLEDRAKRGSARGDIPESPEDWQQYDLVVLIGTPFPGYTAADGQAIADYVRSGDLGLWSVGAGSREYLKSLPDMPFGDLTFAHMRPSDHLLPNPRLDHLPALRLRGEVISNFNAWQSLGAPAGLNLVQPQDLPLLLHPDGQNPVLSLGIHGAGKLAIMGMSGMEPMLAWQPAEFDRWISRLTADLLIPAYDASAQAAKLAIYPPVGTAGRPAILVAPAGENVATVDVAVDGPDGQSTVTLTARDGWLRGELTLATPGDYTLTTPSGTLPYRVRAQVSAETRDTTLNVAFLRDYAAAAGGRYVPLAELADALAALPARERTHVDSQTWRLLDWRLPLLLLFLVFAAADFSLRKFLGLVL